MKAFSFFIGATLLIFYLEGLFATISDDYRYDAKHMIAALALPPYAVYAGVTHAHRITTIPAETEKRFKQCMGITRKRTGVPRANAEEYCHCSVIEKKGDCEISY